jgi:hypothetical protein
VGVVLSSSEKGELTIAVPSYYGIQTFSCLRILDTGLFVVITTRRTWTTRNPNRNAHDRAIRKKSSTFLSPPSFVSLLVFSSCRSRQLLLCTKQKTAAEALVRSFNLLTSILMGPTQRKNAIKKQENKTDEKVDVGEQVDRALAALASNSRAMLTLYVQWRTQLLRMSSIVLLVILYQLQEPTTSCMKEIKVRVGVGGKLFAACVSLLVWLSYTAGNSQQTLGICLTKCLPNFFAALSSARNIMK